MATPLDYSALAQTLADQNASWEMDPDSPILKLSEQEQDRLFGFVPGPGDESLEAAVRADANAALITPQQLQAEADIGAPTQFDQRNINGKSFVTAVKNQGGCGSCVAFGTAAVMETTYQRQTNNPNSQIDLSEAHLFYCHGGEEGRNCGNGWWPDKALAKAKDKGVATEDMYPYTGAQQACSVQSGWQNSMARSSGHNKISGRAAIKRWIAERGSVTGCFIVYQDFLAYRSGVYRHVSGAQRGGHCVEICGYDDARACWICKNSWGTGWGEGGFFKIGYGQCRIDSWAGPYGCTGVSLRQWLRNTKVTGLWSNDSENNAWAYLSGAGWRKLQNNSTATHHAMLLELTAGKAAGRKVSALLDDKKIEQIYVV